MKIQIDQSFEAQHFIPLLLRHELSLDNDNLVKRFAFQIAGARDLGANAIAEQGLQRRDNTQGIQDHVPRVLLVGGNSDDAAIAQACDRSFHSSNGKEERKRDHRLHHIELQLAQRRRQA